jgi:adenine-specific DNA-methyltransferase
MDKMKCETVDGREKNIKALKTLFPECVTECEGNNGKIEERVNYEILRQMLGEGISKESESYEFTWVGKRNAFIEANRPTRSTLRPVINDSIDWNSTENLFIEGDNLTVLKLLQESYLGAIKMI